METYRDVNIGAGELMAKVIRDIARPKSMAATRLPCRFAGYNQVESLAMSLRLMHRLTSQRQLARPVNDLTASSTRTWSADFSGGSYHGN